MEKLKVCMNPTLPTSYTEALSYLEDLGRLRYELDQVIKAVNAGQTFYILPIATDTTLGGVKAVSKTDESHKVAIDADGQIWSAYPTTADNQTLGLVKGKVKTDEDVMVAVDENGEMWYKTPEIATDKIAGIVKAVIKDAQTHKVAIDTEGQLYSDYPDVASIELGLVRGNKKTANQTTPVGIDVNGNMWVDTSVDIPQATGTQLGGVKANSATSGYTGDVRIDSNGKLKVKEYTLPVASANLGGVRVVARTIQNHPVGIDKNNQFLYSDYPANATNETAGIVKAKAKTDETVEVAVDTDGKLYVPANSGLQPASDSVLGGIKAKTRTNEDRKVAIGDDNYAYYRIPQASALEVGGIKADPRNTATDTNEVKIDSTTGKLYTSAGGVTTIPKATSTTIGGILANPATAKQTVPVGIGSDGQLYTESMSLIEASKVNIGGIRVSYGGTDTGSLPAVLPSFQPDATNYPLMAGKRVPYSVNTQNGAGLETYGYEVYIDLSETSESQITPSKLNDYISYADKHAFNLSIYAKDNDNITRYYHDTGKVAGKDRVFVTTPYINTNNENKLTVSTLTINTEGEYAYFVESTVIEPEVVLPARENRYGTIKAATRTANETAEVKIDTSTGKLYAPAGGGTGGDSPYMVYDCGTTLTLKPDFWTNFLHPCLRAGKLPMIKLKQGTQGRQFTFTCDTVYNNEPLESNQNELYFKAIQNINLTSAGDDTNSIDIRVFKLPIATQQSGVIVWELGNIAIDVV